jgi:outer membrane protein OmpA-like peptidoglycan-associated protein
MRRTTVGHIAATIGPAACALFVAMVLASCNQIGGATSAIPGGAPSLSLDSGHEDAISTSFADAEPGTALPGGAAPTAFESLEYAPRGSHGGFLLAPGAYQLKLRSYCLHAGTHGPSGGEGYLYAPLKGSRAQIIQAVLRNSEYHLEIKQTDVQALIWALEVFVPPRSMSSDLRQVADTLLGEKAINELNGGAASWIPAPLTDAAMSRAPAAVRQVYAAQAELQRQLISGTASYEQMQATAVLAGPPSTGASVPRGEWSKHPGGFYVRYLPSKFSTTTVQVYVPEPARTGERTTDPVPAHFASFTSDLGRASGEIAVSSPPEYDPTADVATPANAASQRLGLSAVPTEAKAPPPLGAELAKDCRAELQGLYFGFNSAEILPASNAELGRIAGMMRAQPSWDFTIEGHTDSVGTASENLALSTRRAQALKDALVSRGIAAARLDVAGRGATQPKESNATPEGRAHNRRVELVRHCAAGH